jgi:hypothetical protein
VPSVFILNASTAKALITHAKSLPFVNLIGKNSVAVNSNLELFNKAKNDGTYNIFIINEEMGTGTNFLTNTTIETNGGLVLVIGIKPTNTGIFDQLNCRVGRIFNKGRRFYIILDTEYEGPSQNYLKH